FADADHREERELAADAYEQLGYLAESATWRNAYLYAAQELRSGAVKAGRGQALNPETIAAIPTETLFDLFGAQLNGPKADGKHIVVNWKFTDTRESFVLALEDATLTATANTRADRADASLSLSRDALNAIALRRLSVEQAIQSEQIKVEGAPAKVAELFSLLDTSNPNFEVVEP